AVTQHVGGRNILKGRATVHLLPQELLGLGEQQEPVGGGVLEEEAALTCHARGDLGKLPRLRGHPLRPRLHEGGGAADLTDVETFVLAADQQLELRPARRRGRRRGGGLAHRASRSSPVASTPQRVTSATRSPEARSRSMNTCTSAWKNAAAARGLSSVSRRSPARASTSRVTSESDCTVAERGEGSKSAISPKKRPGPM